MTVALLTIGNELLRGEIDNANGRWLAEHLTDNGFTPAAIETVADDHVTLVATLKRMLAQHELVLATGGLGPTSDDLTAAAAADVAGVDLVTHEDALAAIRRRVEERGMEMRPGHAKQAMLPDGISVIPNNAGTAPGFVLEVDGARSIFMPGVAAEMRSMFHGQVLVRIRVYAQNDCF
jgi:nicotinamide-nucleotide amidase